MSGRPGKLLLFRCGRAYGVTSYIKSRTNGSRSPPFHLGRRDAALGESKSGIFEGHRPHHKRTPEAAAGHASCCGFVCDGCRGSWTARGGGAAAMEAHQPAPGDAIRPSASPNRTYPRGINPTINGPRGGAVGYASCCGFVCDGRRGSLAARGSGAAAMDALQPTLAGAIRPPASPKAHEPGWNSVLKIDWRGSGVLKTPR